MEGCFWGEAHSIDNECAQKGKIGYESIDNECAFFWDGWLASGDV